MFNEIVLAIDPALRKIEDILLWKKKFKTAAIFTFFHFLFWIFQSFSIRTYCIISCFFLFIHLLDAYRAKKRRELIRLHTNKNLIETISSLGRWIIYAYNKLGSIYASLRRLKQRNRLKYFLFMLLFWSMTAVIGVKIKGFYIGYSLFWILFVVPAILHYDIPRKVLSKALPILEQLDQSMKYERRSILDKKELLVDVKLPQSDLVDIEQEDEYLKSFQLEDVDQVKTTHRRAFNNQPVYDEDEEEEDEEEEEEDDNVDEDDEEGEEIEEEFEYQAKRPVPVYKQYQDNRDQDQEVDDGYDEQTKVSQTSINQQTKKTIEYGLHIDDDDDDLNSLMPVGSLPNINDVTTSILHHSPAPTQQPTQLSNDNSYDQTEDYSLLKNPKVIRRKTKNRPSLLDYYGDSIKVTEHENTEDQHLVDTIATKIKPAVSPSNYWKYSNNSNQSPLSSSASSSSSSLLTSGAQENTNKMMQYTQSNNIINESNPSRLSFNRRSTHNDQDIDETFDFLDEELNKYDNNN